MNCNFLNKYSENQKRSTNIKILELIFTYAVRFSLDSVKKYANETGMPGPRPSGVASARLSEINQSLAETLLPPPTNSLVTMKRARGDVVCQSPHAGTFLEKG